MELYLLYRFIIEIIDLLINAVINIKTQHFKLLLLF